MYVKRTHQPHQDDLVLSPPHQRRKIDTNVADITKKYAAAVKFMSMSIIREQEQTLRELDKEFEALDSILLGVKDKLRQEIIQNSNLAFQELGCLDKGPERCVSKQFVMFIFILIYNVLASIYCAC